MARSTRTPKAAARSSPRGSAAKSTPQPTSKKGTPLKQSAVATPTSTRSGRSVGKGKVTSPYFAKGKGKNGSAKKGKKEEVEDDDDEGFLSATGMTESEVDSSEDNAGSEDDFGPSEGEDVEEAEEESDEESVDSDFLDEEDDKGKGKKRKTVGKSSGAKAGSAKKAKSSTKGSKPAKAAANGGTHEGIEGYEHEDEDDDDTDLEEGQELAGRIYPAPKTGQVPPGEISKNTLNFLKNLQIPERNDREWFKCHEPSFRQAEKEWIAFVGLLQQKLHEADDEIPILPPKDIIHRIYRDVRFSSDKTPYKKGFSCTTSRGGRKGLWACYHLSISPNDRSMLAAGIWMPGKNETASIRHHLMTDPQRFRDTIGEKEFVKLFGEAKEKKGERSNVFGHEDALKVAPKGVDKAHKDIDLLKLRSVAVVHKFTDEEVLQEDFQDKVQDIVRVLVPFVRLLNDYISLPPTDDDN
ncbi:hypothetical protein IAT38_008043 [Cryptococcus sp. DSM 104549]